MERQRRLHPIDSLRGLASLGVAIPFHFRYLTGDRSVVDPAAMPLGGVPGVRWLYQHGDLLVELFFVISGFVFHYIYRDRRTPTNAGAADFALARFARLYPLLFASTLVTGLLLLIGRALAGPVPLGFGVGPADWARHLLLLQVLKVEPASLNPATWSVSVEVVCYLLFYLLARGRSAVFYGGTGIAVLLGLSGLGFVAPVSGLVPWFMARGLLGFFLGVLAYATLPWSERLPTPVLAVLLAGGVALAWMQPGPLTRFSGNALVTCLVWPPLVLLSFRRPLALLLNGAPLRKLGDLSYSIYLVHMPVLIAILLVNGGRPLADSRLAPGLVAYALAVLGVAALSFRYLEMPARRSLRRSPPRSPTAELPT